MNAPHTQSRSTPTQSSSRLVAPVKLALAVAISAMFVSGAAFAQGQGQGRDNAPGQQSASGIKEERFVAGRLLVQARPGLSEEQFQRIIRTTGGRQVGAIPGINVRVIQLPPQASERAVEALLRSNPHIKFAERDLLLEPTTSNDPHYGSAWHLPKIGADYAWATGRGEGVVVAILDTGVDANHPDLAGQLVPGWNFVSNNADSSDIHGHGTRVAGTVAALTNNGIGVASVAGDAKIMPLVVANADGYGSYSAMASALVWAADRGARVANLSFYGPSWSASVRSAAQYMKDRGGLVMVSAGNDGSDTSATFPPTSTMIIISATASNDTKTSWSTYGDYVDLAAPGASIWTTNRGGGYGAVSGTSFSAPITAAAAALVMSVNPLLKSTEVEQILYSTAVDLGASGWDKYYGHGRVDAFAAVSAAGTTVAKDTIAPSVSIVNPKGGASVAGLVTVDVSATDNVGVSRVDFHVNGKKIAADSISPFGFSWDSASVADGSVSLAAYAYDDAGNFNSHAVTVTVNNVVAEPEPEPEPEPTPAPTPDAQVDVIAPVALISSPSDGSKVNGNVNVNASATDNVGVVQMRLYHNGNLMATSNGASVSYRWNARTASIGNHTWKVEADDAAGNTGSHSVIVTR